MLRKITSTLALTIGLAIAGLTALPSNADAKKFWWPHNHHGIFLGVGHQHHGGIFGGGIFGGGIFLGPPIVFDDGPYYRSGCGWLHAKAERTGSSYWWRRYHVCRYGY
jgi:hypothetical protein